MKTAKQYSEFTCKQLAASAKHLFNLVDLAADYLAEAGKAASSEAFAAVVAKAVDNLQKRVEYTKQQSRFFAERVDEYLEKLTAAAESSEQLFEASSKQQRAAGCYLLAAELLKQLDLAASSSRTLAEQKQRADELAAVLSEAVEVANFRKQPASIYSAAEAESEAQQRKQAAKKIIAVNCLQIWQQGKFFSLYYSFDFWQLLIVQYICIEQNACSRIEQIWI